MSARTLALDEGALDLARGQLADEVANRIASARTREVYQGARGLLDARQSFNREIDECLVIE